MGALIALALRLGYEDEPNRVVRVATARMVEEKEGAYKYSLRLDPSWPEGDYTVICSEARYGTMDTLILTVKRPDMATLAAAGGAVPRRASAEDQAAEIKAISASVEIAEARLKKAAEAMVRMQEGVAGSGEVAEEVGSLYNDLKGLGAKLKGLGTDPAGLSEVAENRATDFVYLRNKMQELRALVEFSRRLLEPSLMEEPIIQVWMEFR